MYDITIIGGGVTGCFIARQLCRYDLEVVLIEKNYDVANETTKANSGIIHSGYDARPGTLKAKLNTLGNPMFDEICSELGVPLKRIGSLTIAKTDKEMGTLKKLYERGCTNGIPQLSLIDADAVRRIEPNIHHQVKGALLAETAGIIDPFCLTIALAENASDNGTEVKLETRVVGIDREKDGYLLTTDGGSIRSRYVISCAGVYAEEINDLLTPSHFKIAPRKGDYVVFDKKTGGLVNHVIFQCPSEKGKGVLVTPTVHGNLLVGPDSAVVKCKDDVSTTRSGLDEILATSAKSVEGIPVGMAITNFSGLRATPDTGDFIIEELKGHKGFINVAGIESPGLTASPAIADYVIEILKSSGLDLKTKADFNPIREPIAEFIELSDEEKSTLIKANPLYGRVICRCENITEGEIVDSIRRNVGARSVDGVKRRVRAGMGRCQGGFCAPRIIEILARELQKNACQILKDEKDSYILSGEI